MSQVSDVPHGLTTSMMRRRVLPLLALGGLSVACRVTSSAPAPTPRPDNLDTDDKRQVADYLESLADKIGRTPGFLAKWSHQTRVPGLPKTMVMFETPYDLEQTGKRLLMPEILEPGLATYQQLKEYFWASLLDLPEVYLSKLTINGTPIRSAPQIDYPAQYFWLFKIQGLSPKFNQVTLDHFSIAKSEFVYAFDGRPITGNMVQLTTNDFLLHK